MKENIRIVGLDLDGTTLTREKKITPRVRNVIEQATADGVVVLPATGRTVSGVPEEILSVKGIRYMLVSNGARIYDRETKASLIEVCMDKNLTNQILDIMEPFDVQINPYIEGKAYITRNDMDNLERFVAPEFLKYFRTTREIVPDLREFMNNVTAGTEKINVVFADMEERQQAIEALKQMPDIAVTSSVTNNLELNHVNANKGDALLALGRLWGYDRKQIMACGDSGNDSTMIEKAGLGVAMANAAEEIKAIADYITLSNEDDGVAHAFEKFVI